MALLSAMTLICLLCHCFTGCLGCLFVKHSLHGLQCVGPWSCGSALIAAVIRAGQEHRAELLSGELGCPGTALLLPCWLPVLLGKNSLAWSCLWLNHSQQQSVTCIKLLFCRRCAHFPCIPWLCKLCAHWAHWVWCHGFQREAWLFSQSHFLHFFCSLLHHLTKPHSV